MEAKVLVTGASGYVGSRLVASLLRDGAQVVAAARSVEKLKVFDWHDAVEVVSLDVTDPASVDAALASVGPLSAAYYLIHAIGQRDFVSADRESARTFAQSAKTAQVGRIVYLGGLIPDGEVLSEHLESRVEVGEVLQRHGPGLVWLRAGAILGAGSASFELIRHLANRLRVVPKAPWMDYHVHPIAVDDALRYLVLAAKDSLLKPGGYDLVGPDSLPYWALFEAYAAPAGLRRTFIPAPMVSPAAVAGVIARSGAVSAGPRSGDEPDQHHGQRRPSGPR